MTFEQCMHACTLDNNMDSFNSYIMVDLWKYICTLTIKNCHRYTHHLTTSISESIKKSR